MTATFEPTWQQIDGVDVMRVGDEPVAALPHTGKRSAAKFIVFDVQTRETLCYLTAKEVRSWLFRDAKGRADEAKWAAEDAIRIRADKLARVTAYLAKRAARPVQITFQF